VFATPIRTVSALTRVQPGWQLGFDGPIYHRPFVPYDNASDAYIEALVETVCGSGAAAENPPVTSPNRSTQVTTMK